MRALCILIGLLLCAAALTQPELVPQPPLKNDDMQVLAEITKAADAAITALAQDTLASTRLEGFTKEGLVVAPFSVLTVEGDGDDFMRFAVTWTQERMTNAMIKVDAAGRFAVIDRAFIAKAIEDQKLDAKALADPKNWQAIGQAAGANYLVTGAIGILPLGEHPLKLSFTLTARIVSVTDGRAVAAGCADFVFSEQP